MYLFLLKKLLKFIDADTFTVDAVSDKNVTKQLTRKIQFLNDAAKIVETDIACVADIVLGKLFFENARGYFAVDFLHKFLQFLNPDHSLFARSLHFVEAFAKPSLLVKSEN